MESDDSQPCGHEPDIVPTERHPPEVLNRAAEILGALSDPGRLALLERLREGEICVSSLAESNNMSTVSQRLRLLRNLGLVHRRREGRHMYYSLADDHVAQLLDNVLEHAAELMSAKP